VADEPTYRVGGSTELEYGDRSALQKATSAAGEPMTLPEVTDAAPTSGIAFEPDTGGEPDPDVDAALFAPTDFPDRPLTHGMSFGPGANVSPNPDETEDQFMHRFAIRTLEVDAPEENKIWAARRLAGA
jgi:hypothetical protein